MPPHWCDGRMAKPLSPKQTARARERVSFRSLVCELAALVAEPRRVLAGAAAGDAGHRLPARLLNQVMPDEYAADIRAALSPGSSALVALVHAESLDDLARVLQQREGDLYRYSLSQETARQLGSSGENKLHLFRYTLPARLEALCETAEAELAALSQEIERLTPELQRAPESSRRRIEKRIHAARERRQAVRRELHQKLESHLLALNDEIRKLRQDAQIDHELQLEALNAARDLARAKLEASLEEHLRELDAEIEALKAATRTVPLARQEALDAELRRRRVEREVVYARVQTNLQTQFEELTAEIKEFTARRLLAAGESKSALHAHVYPLYLAVISILDKLAATLERQLAGLNARLAALERETPETMVAEAKRFSQLHLLRDQRELVYRRLQENLRAQPGEIDRAIFILNSGIATDDGESTVTAGERLAQFGSQRISILRKLQQLGKDGLR